MSDKVSKYFFNSEETTHQNPPMEIIERDTFNEEEYFLFQSIFFDMNPKT
jgi:hypothetical protein